MSSEGEYEEDTHASSSGPKYSLPALTPAKRIHVYKNGDTYFAGKQVLVNPRYTRTWNAFLEQLNQSFKLSTGAVQRLHTPLHGHSVDDLNKLESGSDYVVSGPERFRRLNYSEIRTRNLSPPKSRKKELVRETNEAKPVVHSKIQAEPRVKAFMQPKTVYFYRNGDEFSKAMLMLLRPRDMQNWEQVLQVVSDKVMLSNNTAIRRIYKISGEEINSVEELDNNQFYVAAGYERFIPTAYGRLPPNLVFVPSRKKVLNDVKFLSQIPTPPKQESFSSETAQGKPVPEANPPKRTSRGKTKTQLKPVDYDQDSSGVFRATKPHVETKNARTIDIEERSDRGHEQAQEQEQEVDVTDESANRTHRVKAVDSNEESNTRKNSSNAAKRQSPLVRKSIEQPKPEPERKSHPEPKPQAEPKAYTEPEPEPEPEHEAEVESEVEIEPKLEVSEPVPEKNDAAAATEPERNPQGDDDDDGPEHVRAFVFGARSPAESAEPESEMLNVINFETERLNAMPNDIQEKAVAHEEQSEREVRRQKSGKREEPEVPELQLDQYYREEPEERDEPIR